MTQMLAKDMDWPHCKGSVVESNVWNTGLAEMMEAMNGAKDDAWWICDSELKYLNLRIDTRDNAFWLTVTDLDGEKKRIDPQRVINAINTFNERYSG